MINGRNNTSRRLRTLLCGIALFGCLVAGLAVAGCRSSRKCVGETYSETRSSVRKTARTDTVSATATSCKTSADSAAISARLRAVVNLKRDSAGRIVEIHAERSTEIGANRKRETDRGAWFGGVKTSFRSETADSVGHIVEKKEETQEEVNASTPLSSFVVPVSLLLAIIFARWITSRRG